MKQPVKILKHILFVILVNAILGNVIEAITYPGYFQNLKKIPEHTILFVIWGSILWLGIEYIYFWVTKKFSWKKEPVKVLIIGILLSFFYSIAAIFIISYLQEVVYYRIPFKQYIKEVKPTLVFSLTLALIISTIAHAVGFFKAWRESLINEEKLKRERLTFQYEALKNQVNPHFLFNSLNVLTSLVYKDADLSARFIKQLSEVYRYVLDQKDKEVVELSEEIKFVESYIYLHKMRFEENLITEINIPTSINGYIIPLSLQMLVENAIKHNTISKNEPLQIKIYIDNDYVIVSNNIQRKAVLDESSNIGLSNIKDRYEYLTNKPFIISDNGKHFVAKLPIININLK